MVTNIEKVIAYMDEHGSITNLESTNGLKVLNFTHIISHINRNLFKIKKTTQYKILIGKNESIVTIRPKIEYKLLKKWTKYERKHKSCI